MASQDTIRSLRFHDYGAPGDVLSLDRIAPPACPAGRIRIVVHACALNPADWALCRGLSSLPKPSGIGLEAAGVVNAVGEGVTGIAVGDRVFGMADYAAGTTAGAADQALLKHWAKTPAGLSDVAAASLPMATEVAVRSVEMLGVKAGQTVLVNGAGTMMGFAAVQVCVMKGARVFAAAGATFNDQLKALGAAGVTTYGEGMADRVIALAGGPMDLVLDSAPQNTNALPGCIAAAGGDPKKVLTVADFMNAGPLGVRTHWEAGGVTMRYDALEGYAKLAAEGKFTIPVTGTYDLEDWRPAAALSDSFAAKGKLVLLVVKPASA